MDEPYDSTEDTELHIATVQHRVEEIVNRIGEQVIFHDATKLLEPEKSIYDQLGPIHRRAPYGSPEHAAALALAKTALDHHYAHNRHHPQFHPNGIAGMTLIDLIEMLCDWKAAGEVHVDGSLEQSITVNAERYDISEQLVSILENTRKAMGWK